VIAVEPSGFVFFFSLSLSSLGGHYITKERKGTASSMFEINLLYLYFFYLSLFRKNHYSNIWVVFSLHDGLLTTDKIHDVAFIGDTITVLSLSKYSVQTPNFGLYITKKVFRQCKFLRDFLFSFR
jgi:hypothetical protein